MISILYNSSTFFNTNSRIQPVQTIVPHLIRAWPTQEINIWLFQMWKAFNQSGNLKVHERTHTEPLNNKNISLQAMWKDIWMILNLWNLEAAGIWSDSIPIPHQISIPQYFKTSEPQYQYQYQYQQNWKPQYQYQYQYHSKPQYLNTWYWYCLCLLQMIAYAIAIA